MHLCRFPRAVDRAAAPNLELARRLSRALVSPSGRTLVEGRAAQKNATPGAMSKRFRAGRWKRQVRRLIKH